MPLLLAGCSWHLHRVGNGSKTRALRALPLASGTGLSNVLLAALVLIKFSKENAAQGVLLFSLVYLGICSWLTK